MLPVHPDDDVRVRQSAELLNAAVKVDDPGQPLPDAELQALDLRYGWDLEPSERFLYLPEDGGEPVGVLELHTPKRDNRHLAWAELTVHPDHRRRGHGSALLAEFEQRSRGLGRSLAGLGVAADDEAAQRFVRRHGYSYAAPEARRKQVLAEVDRAGLDRLRAQASAAARDYDLVRTMAPVGDDLLATLVEVTAAINDAPRGELKMEDEVFDVQRLKDVESAAAGKGQKLYRVYARHRPTGQVGGHTVMMVQPRIPGYAWQYDTAVHRDHRGHRLGLLLKIDMMDWLARAEPHLEVIETWNNAENTFMINVNEAIGYRLSRVFHEYQKELPAG